VFLAVLQVRLLPSVVNDRRRAGLKEAAGRCSRAREPRVFSVPPATEAGSTLSATSRFSGADDSLPAASWDRRGAGGAFVADTHEPV